MHFSLKEYLKFYWVTYFVVRAQHFPGISWRTEFNDGSPEMWTSDILGKKSALGKELFGRTSRYIYLVTTYFSERKTEYMPVDDNFLILAFRNIGCYIPEEELFKFIDDEELAVAYYEIFKSKFPEFVSKFPAIEKQVDNSLRKIKEKIHGRPNQNIPDEQIIEKPNLIPFHQEQDEFQLQETTFDPVKNESTLDKVNSLELNDSTDLNEQTKSDSDLELEKAYASRFEKIVENANQRWQKKVQERNDLFMSSEGNQILLNELLNNYYKHLEERNYRLAMMYWLPSIQQERWSKNFNKFAAEFLNIKEIYSSAVFKTSLKWYHPDDSDEERSEIFDTFYDGQGFVVYEQEDFDELTPTSFKIDRIFCHNHGRGWFIKSIESIQTQQRFSSDELDFSF